MRKSWPRIVFGPNYLYLIAGLILSRIHNLFWTYSDRIPRQFWFIFLIIFGPLNSIRSLILQLNENFLYNWNWWIWKILYVKKMTSMNNYMFSYIKIYSFLKFLCRIFISNSYSTEIHTFEENLNCNVSYLLFVV